MLCYCVVCCLFYSYSIQRDKQGRDSKISDRHISDSDINSNTNSNNDINNCNDRQR